MSPFGRATQRGAERTAVSVWVESDTGCGFGQKQVANYTMIHPDDIQTEKKHFGAESSLSLAWTISEYDVGDDVQWDLLFCVCVCMRVCVQVDVYGCELFTCGFPSLCMVVFAATISCSDCNGGKMAAVR